MLLMSWQNVIFTVDLINLSLFEQFMNFNVFISHIFIGM